MGMPKGIKAPRLNPRASTTRTSTDLSICSPFYTAGKLPGDAPPLGHCLARTLALASCLPVADLAGTGIVRPQFVRSRFLCVETRWRFGDTGGVDLSPPRRVSYGEAMAENLTETITLYRPTGPKELALVRESGWT